MSSKAPALWSACVHVCVRARAQTCADKDLRSRYKQDVRGPAGEGVLWRIGVRARDMCLCEFNLRSGRLLFGDAFIHLQRGAGHQRRDEVNERECSGGGGGG